MADEIKISVRVSHSKIPKLNIQPSQFSIDQSGTGSFTNTVSIGTSEEDVDFSTIFPDLGTEGYCYLENLDATNYVQWGAKDTTMKTIGRLRAGEFAIFRYEPSVILRMQANTGACLVYVAVYED